MTDQELANLRLQYAQAGMQVFVPVAAIIQPPRNQGTRVQAFYGQTGTLASFLGQPRSLTFNSQRQGGMGL